MGGGSYSFSAREARSVSQGYQTKSREELFSNDLNADMNPKHVGTRESRDSEEHPESVAIILALDVTGSMGDIPHGLLKDGLPHIMGNIIERGMKDPQMMFLAIGDHKCDNAPLQVGQFESSDELLDKWLTSVYLEGMGGGNGGESYHLAWYLAAMRTSIDCFEKRGRKGYLFTIGDEPVHRTLSASSLHNVMEKGEFKDYTAAELLALAREKYEVYHLHMKQGHNGTRQEVIGGWKELMGDHCIVVKDRDEVANVISKIANESYHGSSDLTDGEMKGETVPDEPQQEEATAHGSVTGGKTPQMM